MEDLLSGVMATLARSASTSGAGGDTDLEIACLTASPERSGLVPLICFGGPGLAEATSWVQGERVSRAARRRYSHIAWELRNTRSDLKGVKQRNGVGGTNPEEPLVLLPLLFGWFLRLYRWSVETSSN